VGIATCVQYIIGVFLRRSLPAAWYPVGQMIGYVTLGTVDFDRAVSFYDELFDTIGVSRLWKHDSMAAWGPSREQASLCIAKPFDGEAASVGNGVMVALKMVSRNAVDAFHGKAIALGGLTEGAPGERGDHGFYGAYFRDLDGNKLGVYIPAS